MTTRQFIDQLAAGESSAAKETLENVLSSRSFEALDVYKKNIASNLFSNQENTPEVEVQDAE